MKSIKNTEILLIKNIEILSIKKFEIRSIKNVKMPLKNVQIRLKYINKFHKILMRM